MFPLKKEAKEHIMAAQPFVNHKAQIVGSSIKASDFHQQGLHKQDTDGGNLHADHLTEKLSLIVVGPSLDLVSIFKETKVS